MSVNLQKTHIETSNYQGKTVQICVQHFKEKAFNVPIGVDIGDAGGVPTEMMIHKDIDEKFGRVQSYLDANNSVLIQRAVRLSEGKLELPEDGVRGVISDDSEFQNAGIRSFLETENLQDYENLMKHLLATYESYPYGFGRSTEQAFERYKKLQSLDPNNASYINLGGLKQSGNGVLMKQAPYAVIFLAQGYLEVEIENTMANICKITHGSPLAIVSSIIHNKLLMELLKVGEGETLDFIELFTHLQQYSQKLETSYGTGQEDRISLLIQKLLNDHLQGGLDSYEEILDKYGWGEKHVYSSGYIIYTLGIVYTLFLKRQNFEALLDCTNIGGDTDTYAAIMGGMLGAYKGMFYKQEFIDGLDDKQNLVTLAKKFSEKIGGILHNT